MKLKYVFSVFIFLSCCRQDSAIDSESIYLESLYKASVEYAREVVENAQKVERFAFYQENQGEKMPTLLVEVFNTKPIIHSLYDWEVNGKRYDLRNYYQFRASSRSIPNEYYNVEIVLTNIDPRIRRR